MSDLRRVTIRGETAGEAFANVLYFDGMGKTSHEVCDAIYAVWIPWMANACCSNFKYTSVTALEVGHLILDPDYYTRVEDHAGAGNGSNKTDPQLAVCFQLHTGLAGKKRRGRFFQAGTPDEGVENGRLTSGQIQLWQSTITDHIAPAYMGSSPAQGIKLVVFSKTIYDGLTDIILDSYKPVTSLTLNTVLSTMRTRKPSSV